MSDQSSGGDVFNTYPELSDEELARKAVALKAQLYQVTGEMARRPDVLDANPLVIEEAIGDAVQEVIFLGFVMGTFAAEHDVLQVIVDAGGQLKGTVFDSAATDTVLVPQEVTA